MHAFLSSVDFVFKLTFSKKVFQEQHQSVKQFGSRSGLTFFSGLIWVQTVCRGYQQMTKVTTSGERVETITLNLYDA